MFWTRSINNLKRHFQNIYSIINLSDKCCFTHTYPCKTKTIETSEIEAPLSSKLHQKGRSPNGPECVSGPTFCCNCNNWFEDSIQSPNLPNRSLKLVYNYKYSFKEIKSSWSDKSILSNFSKKKEIKSIMKQ